MFQQLIITDNKAMADTIAQAIGYCPEDAGLFHYSGNDVEILWTGGAMLDITLKQSTDDPDSIGNHSWQEIIDKYYDVVPRTFSEQIHPLDVMRMEYISEALTYCNEIVFMFQPTDEGVRWGEAIRKFFDIQIPVRKVMLNCMSEFNIKYNIEYGRDFGVITDYQTTLAMRRIYLNDHLCQRHSVHIEGLRVSPHAMKLLSSIIQHMDYRFKYGKGSITNKYELTNCSRLHELVLAMMMKYGLVNSTIWDSVLYLYAKGLIYNPMQIVIRDTYSDIYNGQADIHLSNNELQNRITRTSGRITPTDIRDYELLSIPYDAEKDGDRFFPRTAAIYRHIVEADKVSRKELDSVVTEIKSVPTRDEMPILESFVLFSSIINSATCGNSQKYSAGALLDELFLSEFLYTNGHNLVINDYDETVKILKEQNYL